MILNKVSIIEKLRVFFFLFKFITREKLSFEQRLEGEQGVFWGTIDPIRRNSQCKTLRQNATWCVQQTARKLLWLPAEPGESERDETGTRKQGVQGQGAGIGC